MYKHSAPLRSLVLLLLPAGLAIGSLGQTSYTPQGIALSSIGVNAPAPLQARISLAALSPLPAVGWKENSGEGRLALGVRPYLTEDRGVYYTSDQIDVRSSDNSPDLYSLQPSYRATDTQIRDTPGAYSDVSRYVQVNPGVLSVTDSSNTYIARGGNPWENSFVVNGLDVPSINHLSLANSGGGFVSMVSTEDIDRIDFKTSDFSMNHDVPLSSMMEITTKDFGEARRPGGVINVGYVGADVLIGGPMPLGGNWSTSYQRSLLNYFTDDIGLDGVPDYQSNLSTVRMKPGPKDRLTLTAIGGLDSIDIRPNLHDNDEPTTTATLYHGNRLTFGVVDTHMLRPNSFITMRAERSSQLQHINQTEEIPRPVESYFEDSRDTGSRIGYDYNLEFGEAVDLRVGSSFSNLTANYVLQQPGGVLSPYSASSVPGDALNTSTDTSYREVAQYGDLLVRPLRSLSMAGGYRVQRWGLLNQSGAEGRVSAGYRFGAGHRLFTTYAKYLEAPPTIEIVSFPQNNHLAPIASRQIDAGYQYSGARWMAILDLYRKQYTQYPVSSEHPQLSSANSIATISDITSLFPMVSAGTGKALGAEALLRATLAYGFTGQISLSRSSARFAGLDGVLRPGDYDVPFAETALLHYIHRGFQVSARYSSMTGRPYTPVNAALSAKQNRAIFDLTQINADRLPGYSRLDLRAEQIWRISRGELQLYLGLDNALNHSNILFMGWRSLCYGRCALYPVAGMGRYPDGGLIYRF